MAFDNREALQNLFTEDERKVGSAVLGHFFNPESDPEIAALKLAIHLCDVNILTQILARFTCKFDTAVFLSASAGWLKGVKTSLKFIFLPFQDIDPEIAARSLECAARRCHVDVIGFLLGKSDIIGECVFEIEPRKDLRMEEAIYQLILAGFRKEKHYGNSVEVALLNKRPLAFLALLLVCNVPRIVTREFLSQNPESRDYLSELIDGEFALSCTDKILAKISAANPEAGEKIVALRATNSTAES